MATVTDLPGAMDPFDGARVDPGKENVGISAVAWICRELEPTAEVTRMQSGQLESNAEACKLRRRGLFASSLLSPASRAAAPPNAISDLEGDAASTIADTDGDVPFPTAHEDVNGAGPQICPVHRRTDRRMETIFQQFPHDVPQVPWDITDRARCVWLRPALARDVMLDDTRRRLPEVFEAELRDVIAGLPAYRDRIADRIDDAVFSATASVLLARNGSVLVDEDVASYPG
eukprot:CAMPEP_0117570538 /NCGR_PEP_ID=MMETSP0784-20121206/59253_1 /TAXON_ID=39447 /ORGANISM="" /LENGTH=230 /DNA_ID=CAMNT_0005368601 /DNA_START=106 /DNA_END=800 /DNA_ORIENTATION=+